MSASIFSPLDSSKVYFPAYKANTNNHSTVLPSSSALTDNCATGHIWKDLSHYVGDLIPDCSNICGIGKEVSNWKGTVSFQLTNDNGKSHQITLSNVPTYPAQIRTWSLSMLGKRSFWMMWNAAAKASFLSLPRDMASLSNPTNTTLFAL